MLYPANQGYYPAHCIAAYTGVRSHHIIKLSQYWAMKDDQRVLQLSHPTDGRRKSAFEVKYIKFPRD